MKREKWQKDGEIGNREKERGKGKDEEEREGGKGGVRKRRVKK